ncbi:MAG: triose-phosphate isomerase [Gammaproteobacteria bacterium]
MRTKLVAGNWKMHGSRQQGVALAGGLAEALGSSAPCDVAVCPAFPYLVDVARAVAGTPVALGAQNLCDEDEGAFTGEVSGAMLRDVGCRFVIVGHSERRAIYGESDALVARKFLAAQRSGLLPILCVGETLEEREAGTTEERVGSQLQAVVQAAGIEAFGQAVVAYEPVWAIGTGKTATPEQAQDVHHFIRGLLAEEDGKIADSVRVLYGGSVKPANAAEIFAMPDVDGGLVGGASLEAAGFASICQAAG